MLHLLVIVVFCLTLHHIIRITIMNANAIATSLQGLTPQQVQQSRSRYGTNVLTPPATTSWLKLYLEKYKDPIIQILMVAALISLIMGFFQGEYIETIGIFAAIFLATTVGFVFECDASRRFNVLTSMNDEQLVKVRRDGKVQQIPRCDVVVGDVVLLGVGDEVPADGTLLKAVSLQINESSLTGELLTSKRVVTDEAPADADNESTYPVNRVLRSTMVMNGTAEFVVDAVGDHTEIGKTAMKSTEETHVDTPLNQQLNRLGKLISKLGAVISVLAFVIFLVHDIVVDATVWHSGNYLLMLQKVLSYFMMAVTLIVMAVPEGLPMAITLSLALNMRRMLKSNNLVRTLHACDTMGAVNVICTDKTGTLTQNDMQVAEIELSGSLNHDNPQLLFQSMAINSTAELDEGEGIGNPTEVALLKWMQQQHADYKLIRNGTVVTQQIPFSTEKKYMSTTAQTADGTYEFVKGAPEVVMAMCEMTAAEQEKYQAALTSYQNKAMRTLAIAVRGIDGAAPAAMSMLAVVGIADPVRPEVPQAVHSCVEAGIEIKIVTGDVSATAVEIGRQIGLFADVPQTADLSAYTITGEQWAALSDEEAYERALEIRVMSRARPADKQRLVSMLQKRGNVVAVTGDGTNDAPALHYAHVGLSLGSGTSVAKQASDMTLLDDSFSSIVNAVMWGRSLYLNIQRFLFFQLVVNLTALLLVLGGSIIGTEMPLTVTQILWVNIIMDTFAALALASLPPSREVMRHKPRKPSDFIITRPMLRAIAGWGLLFFVVLFALLVYCERNGSAGIDLHELTLFFTLFVMLQWWNLFNARALGSHHSAFHRLYACKGLLLVLALILLGQFLIVRFGGRMFRTVPLEPGGWLFAIGSTSVVLWIGELQRMVGRWLDRRRKPQAD